MQKSNEFVLMDARLNGKLVVPCDLCNSDVTKVLDNRVKLLISDGIYHGSNEEYDIIEALDSVINLDEILHSEIELIKSDYTLCSVCKEK